MHCKGMWDDLNCWPLAFLGETVSQPCPEFFNSGGTMQTHTHQHSLAPIIYTTLHLLNICQ